MKKSENKTKETENKRTGASTQKNIKDTKTQYLLMNTQFISEPVIKYFQQCVDFLQKILTVHNIVVL